MIELDDLQAYIDQGLSTNEIARKCLCYSSKIKRLVAQLPEEYGQKLKENGQVAQRKRSNKRGKYL